MIISEIKELLLSETAKSALQHTLNAKQIRQRDNATVMKFVQVELPYVAVQDGGPFRACAKQIYANPALTQIG